MSAITNFQGTSCTSLFRLENYYVFDPVVHGWPGNCSFNWRGGSVDTNSLTIAAILESDNPYWNQPEDYYGHLGPIVYYADTINATLSGNPNQFNSQQNIAVASVLTESLLGNYGWTLSMFYCEPVITSQPQSGSANSGDTITFNVSANTNPGIVAGYSATDLTYQWSKDGQIITGATNNYLNKTNITASDVGAYTVTVGHLSLSATSQQALLTVNTPPLPAPILTLPLNSATGQSTTSTFTWSPVANATFYRIIVNTGSANLPTNPTDGTSAGSIINTTVTSNFYTPSTGILSPDTKYYWEVHAGNATTFGNWSNIASFSTASSSPNPGQELITNGGFETGAGNNVNAWSLSGGAGLNTLAGSSQYAHAGSQYLILGGIINESDAAYQSLQIPANATSAALSFYYNITSNENTGAAYDYLTATIRNTGGSVLATIGTWSNLNKDAAAGNPYYHKQTFDLLPYAGQTVSVCFNSTNDVSFPTTFRIDDVSAQVATPTTSGSTTINVAANPNNGGVVTGAGVYPVGTSQTITASANPGYLFTAWNDGSTQTSRSVIVPTSGTSFTANFTKTSGQGPKIALGGYLTFGNVLVGVSMPATLTITNTGIAPLNVSGITLPPGFSGGFSGQIAPNQTEYVAVNFLPTSAISYNGTVTVNSDAVDGINTIPVTGSGTTVSGPAISVTGDMNFGAVPIGSTELLTLTISNPGTLVFHVSGLGYPANWPFSGTWSGDILPGTSQNVTITFSPTEIKDYSGYGGVSCDASSGNSIFPITASGAHPEYSVATLLSDNFYDNSVDSSKWYFSGSSVYESGSCMNVVVAWIDSGGNLDSVPMPLSGTGVITISRNLYLHADHTEWNGYLGTYFCGHCGISIGTLPRINISYADMDWDSYPAIPRHGFIISRNNANPLDASGQADSTGDIPPLWDSWFNEKISYDPVSGVLEYFINDSSKMKFNVGALPTSANPTIQFHFDAWGWWMWHEQLFKNFVVKQEVPPTYLLTRASGYKFHNISWL